LCSWIVLVAEIDERRLVRSLTRSGLAIRPRARMVKGRSKPARGGKAAGTVAGSPRSRAAFPHGRADGGESLGQRNRARKQADSAGAGEGALVEGRRPGSTKRSSLTRRSRQRAWSRRRAGSTERSDLARAWRRQRTSEVMHAGSARGRERRGRVAQRGGAFDRCSARTVQRLATSVIGAKPRARAWEPQPGRSWRFAVKRSSTRGFARGL